MKKILFISNISRKITNFSIPSIKAAQSLGYDFHMAANYSEFNDDESKYDVKIHHIDLARNPFDFKNIKAYKQMIDLINNENIDVIHCNTPIGGILGRLCGHKAKTPKIIYTAHGFHFYDGAPLINNIIFKSAEKWLAKYTDALITINEEDYKYAKKLKLRGNGNVYCIPGVGINTNQFKDINIDKQKIRQSFGLGEEDVVCITMGDLIKRKNYETSIRAIAKLNNKKIHFLICGIGPIENELKNLCENLGVENQVHFLGFREDVKELLKISDIFLFDSFQEGLPRATMEAMASGLPCIVSDIRGNRDLIEDEKGGFLRSPKDINGFSNCIMELAYNKELRNLYSIYNLEKIKSYDVEKVIKHMLNIYKCEINKGVKNENITLTSK